ncbi:ADP-ribosylation factor-like protein 6-interacting protein 1 isoform X1 [Artemia franciscana]|uniref:ADP-ribosylation factor-like protein 6-interacting protein 1 isoform X1 n=1 Tax=Artemia franciscana TaxID=6661 RepID=UPI0032DA3C5B
MAGILESRTVTGEQELRARKLKKSLEHWKEILLALQAALMWERPWSPFMLLTTVSGFFGAVVYFNLSVLTTLSVLGLLITSLDWFIPLVAAAIRNPENWSGIEERKVESLCENIIIAQDEAVAFINALLAIRENRPTMYYAFLSSILLTGAWVGALANNTLLAYFMCCILILLPGLRQHHVFERLFILGVGAFANVVRKSSPPNAMKVKRN